MGIFRKMRAAFHDDWCSRCQTQMAENRRRLFAMPNMMVGHYVSHKDSEYYHKNLHPVSRKADIPTGMYACGLIAYQCPQCGHRAVKASIFLPVRDEEKMEEAILFEKGELDDLVW